MPKIAQDRTRQRLVDHLRQPQRAEQLVEVAALVSYSSFQEVVEQNADIPVRSGRGGRGGLQDLRPGQVSTAFGRADQLKTRIRVLEVFMVSSRDRLLLLHPRTRLVLRMGFYRAFRTFPQFLKKCGVGSALGVGTGRGLGRLES